MALMGLLKGGSQMALMGLLKGGSQMFFSQMAQMCTDIFLTDGTDGFA
jgi:hypothetical protein